LGDIKNWDDLSYWDSGEWQVVEERLNDLDNRGSLYNPSRECIFAALDSTPLNMVKVALIGQDPYPDRDLVCGLSFSVPKTSDRIPPSLAVIFDEYQKDLHLPRPNSGDLTVWTERGVLLWNCIPTCSIGKSLSHNWSEWALLTKEILSTLSTKDIVYIFIGAVSRVYTKDLRLSSPNLKIIEVGHPSPRGQRNARYPFSGSRIFSKANDMLVQLGKEPINWRL